MSEIDEDIHELKTKMALVEQDLKAIAGMKNWLIGGVVIIFLQALGVATGYGILTQKVNSLGGEAMATNVAGNRMVLADHSSEIEGVRTEQARLRQRFDILADRITVFHP